MVFTIETVYDQKAMTAMVRGIRKTLRKKQSKRTRNFGMLSITLGIILLISVEKITAARFVVTLAAIIVILLALIFQDPLNAYFTRRRGLPGLDKAVVTFHEEGYHSATAIGESDFYYDTIACVIDSGDYFVFAFSPTHGQVYDKGKLIGGTAHEFAEFIEKKTGKQLIVV